MFRTFKLVLAIVVALSIGYAGLGFFTVESGKVAVISNFGEYTANIQKPGLRWHSVINQDIIPVSTRVQIVKYGEGKNFDSDSLYSRSRIVAKDSKNTDIGVELTVQFMVNPDQAHKVLADYGTSYFDRGIDPIINQVVYDSVAKYEASQIAVNRVDIVNEVTRNIKDKFKTLPFLLQDVQLKKLDLPDEIEAAIVQVQVAIQEAKKVEEKEKVAVAQKKIKSLEAEMAKIERGGVANGIALIGNALNPQSLKLEQTKLFMERWDGKLPSTLIVNGDATDPSSFLLTLPQMEPTSEEVSGLSVSK